jgi:hypothetical protein
VSGPNQVLTCDTADRRDTFVTPSLSDPYRTPDGRSSRGVRRNRLLSSTTWKSSRT